MTHDHSTTTWIGALKAGHSQAATALWAEYFPRLVALARRKLGSVPKRVADEEDVALSAFRCLCEGAERGSFAQLEDRDDLWQLLATITARKAIDQKRRLGSEKRGGGGVRGESVFAREDGAEAAGLNQVLSDEPTPEFLASLAEVHERLLESLGDDTLRRIAQDKLEGYTNSEIADRLTLTTRSVERKLRRIREKWAPESAS